MIALVALAACSSGPSTPPVSPSPFFHTGPSGPTSAGPTSATGPTTTGGITAPTGATQGGGAGSGPLSRGALALRVTGTLHVTTTLKDLISGTVSQPPGGLALVWTAGGIDATTVGIGGLSFVGTKPTAPTLVLTITVPDGGGYDTFVSSNGECSVTISKATSNSAAGSFTCTGLRSATGATIDATSTFAASG